MRRVIVVALIAIGVSTAIVAVKAHRTVINDPNGHPFVSLYAHAHSGLDALLARGDGQAFAAIARDPSFARPDVYSSDAEAAYRAQRPLLGELAWVASAGQPDAVPGVLAVLVVMSTGLLVAALALLLERVGVSPLFALAVFALPGAVTSIFGLTAEMLAAALATLGLLAWMSSPRRTAPAIVAFSLVAVTRESFLVVPVALALLALVRRAPWRDLAMLGVPVAVYLGWTAIVRARFGSWPTDARAGRVRALPLSGPVDAFRHGGEAGAIAFWLLVAVGLVVLAMMLRAPAELRAVVFVSAAFALFVGQAVWAKPSDFGRALMPLYLYGGVLAAMLACRRATVSV